MKRITRSLLVVAAALLLGRPLDGAAAGSTRFEPSSPARIVLEGRSNLAPWTCRGESLRGEAVVASSLEQVHALLDGIADGAGAAGGSAAGASPRVRMEIPIATLGCGVRAMDRDMFEALDAAQHPSIVFEFRRVAGAVAHDDASGSYRASIDGELRLAGATRPVRMVVTGERLGRDRFRVSGELPVRMTDFGIAPPTGLLGLVKARDELTVRFDFQFRVATQVADSGSRAGR